MPLPCRPEHVASDHAALGVEAPGVLRENHRTWCAVRPRVALCGQGRHLSAPVGAVPGWGEGGVAALSLALATLRLCDPEDVTEAFPAQAPH